MVIFRYVSECERALLQDTRLCARHSCPKFAVKVCHQMSHARPINRPTSEDSRGCTGNEPGPRKHDHRLTGVNAVVAKRGSWLDKQPGGGLQIDQLSCLQQTIALAIVS